MGTVNHSHGKPEQTYQLAAGEELVLTAGIKGCTVMVAIIEGEINAHIASELLRLRELQKALSR